MNTRALCDSIKDYYLKQPGAQKKLSDRQESELLSVIPTQTIDNGYVYPGNFILYIRFKNIIPKYNSKETAFTYFAQNARIKLSLEYVDAGEDFDGTLF